MNERAHCPYLGLRQNRAIRFAAPTAEHRCYVNGEAQEIPVDQRTYCLSINHLSCPLYTGEWSATTAGALAGSGTLALPQRGVRSRLSRRDTLIYLVVLGLIVTLTIIWLGIGLLYSAGDANNSAAPLLIGSPTATTTITPTLTLTASPTRTRTPTASPTATSSPTRTPTTTITPTLTLTSTTAPTQTPVVVIITATAPPFVPPPAPPPIYVTVVTTAVPTAAPTTAPTAEPTSAPTDPPTAAPTAVPTPFATETPVATDAPPAADPPPASEPPAAPTVEAVTAQPEPSSP